MLTVDCGDKGFWCVAYGDNYFLALTAGLDRETGGSQRYVRIIAFDHGVIANTATATLVITVTDINDNAPRFVESSYFFYVSEGASLTTNIGNVTAVDADEEENAIVLFRLHPQFDGLVPFKVITDGVIKTNGILDRETQDRYEKNFTDVKK